MTISLENININDLNLTNSNFLTFSYDYNIIQISNILINNSFFTNQSSLLSLNNINYLNKINISLLDFTINKTSFYNSSNIIKSSDLEFFLINNLRMTDSELINVYKDQAIVYSSLFTANLIIFDNFQFDNNTVKDYNVFTFE